jgi:hypothetical protein
LDRAIGDGAGLPVVVAERPEICVVTGAAALMADAALGRVAS